MAARFGSGLHPSSIGCCVVLLQEESAECCSHATGCYSTVFCSLFFTYKFPQKSYPRNYFAVAFAGFGPIAASPAENRNSQHLTPTKTRECNSGNEVLGRVVEIVERQSAAHVSPIDGPPRPEVHRKPLACGLSTAPLSPNHKESCTPKTHCSCRQPRSTVFLD